VTTYDPIERVRRARRKAASGAGGVALVCAVILLIALKLVTGRSGADAPGRAPVTPPVQDDSADMHWRPFRPGQDLPESRTAGPARHVDGLAAGFERSPLGAALATIHISHRLDASTGPGVFEPTLRDQVVGADADKLHEQVSATYDNARRRQGRGAGEALDPGSARLVAYKVEAYSPDVATVTVISAFDDPPPYFAFRFDVRWTDGDWKLVAPPGGEVQRTELQALPAGAVALSRGT
jgi:hypothetical protein